MIFTIKTILILTGIGVWVFILAIVAGVVGYKIRTWDGWEKLATAWKRGNGHD